MKYFQLQNEYNQCEGLEKLSKKHVSLPSLVSLWRYDALKSLKNAESTFFKNFRALYL